jgi:hypothetical protein
MREINKRKKELTLFNFKADNFKDFGLKLNQMLRRKSY